MWVDKSKLLKLRTLQPQRSTGQYVRQNTIAIVATEATDVLHGRLHEKCLSPSTRSNSLTNVDGHGSTFCPTLTSNSQSAIASLVSSFRMLSTPLKGPHTTPNKTTPAANGPVGFKMNCVMPSVVGQPAQRTSKQTARYAASRQLPWWGVDELRDGAEGAGHRSGIMVIQAGRCPPSPFAVVAHRPARQHRAAGAEWQVSLERGPSGVAETTNCYLPLHTLTKAIRELSCGTLRRVRPRLLRAGSHLGQWLLSRLRSNEIAVDCPYRH